VYLLFAAKGNSD